MGKKEIPPRIPTPTRDQLNRRLEGIEEATRGEESERKRLGVTQEPEGIRRPRPPKLKKLWPEIPTPTGSQLNRRLEGIEKATQEEEYERKRLGVTQEPEARRVPGLPRPKKLWPKEKDIERFDFDSEIEGWGDNNEDYKLETINPSEVRFYNTSDSDISLEFIDNLITGAVIAMEDIAHLKSFSEIKQIRVISVPPETEDIVLYVRDNMGLSAELKFYAESPFVLKSLESEKIGNYDF